MSAEITSRKNELLREFLRLSGAAAYRRKTAHFVAEGARLCADASLSGIKILALLSTEEAQKKVRRLLGTGKKSRAEKICSFSVCGAVPLRHENSAGGILYLRYAGRKAFRSAEAREKASAGS